MTAAMVRTQPSGVADDLEVPRPLRLLLTMGWGLGESVGESAGIRKAATGSVLSLLTISTVVLTLQTAVVLATGELWLFLLQFPLANLCMCVVFARTAGGSNPLVARLAAEVLALRQPASHHPGLHRFFQEATWLWAGIFLLSLRPWRS